MKSGCIFLLALGKTSGMARAALGHFQCSVLFQGWASGPWLVGAAVKGGLSCLAPGPSASPGADGYIGRIKGFPIHPSPEEMGPH